MNTEHTNQNPIENIRENFIERVGSPIFLNFILSWVFVNTNFVLTVIYSDTNTLKTLRDWDFSGFIFENHFSHYYSFILPAMYGIIITILYKAMSDFFVTLTYRCASFTKMTANSAKNKYYSLERINEYAEKIAALKKEREELNTEIEDLTYRRSAVSSEFNLEQRKLEKAKNDLKKMIDESPDLHAGYRDSILFKKIIESLRYHKNMENSEVESTPCETADIHTKLVLIDGVVLKEMNFGDFLWELYISGPKGKEAALDIAEGKNKVKVRSSFPTIKQLIHQLNKISLKR
jgi:cell division protein FtsB